MKLTGLKLAALAMVLALSLGQNTQAATLNALTNAQTVAIGDQFQLTVTTDATNGAVPDLTPLHKDFDVLGTSQSMRTQIINGRQSQQRSWIVTLAPRDKGQLTIPALSAAGLTSQPLTINVVEPSAMPKTQGVEDVTIEATVSGGSHYLYQEIPLVVRIETPLPLKRAELVAPTGSAFELTQNGQDRTSSLVRDGRPVSVIERHYHLRPQQSGAITVPSFTLRGEVDNPDASQSPFGRMPFGGSLMRDFPFGGSAFGGSLFNDMFNPGKPFAARTDPISLQVETASGAQPGEWFLPAKAVDLKSQWQPENPEFRVGEAVTRQISILALGARPEQLPDLDFTAPGGARIYVDDTTVDTFNSPQGTIGRRVITTSIVPTTGGTVTLPEITLNWWDTEAGETKTARIPAETIQVTGSVAAAAAANTEPAAGSMDETPIQDAMDGSPLMDKWTWGAGILALVGALGWAGRRYANRPTATMGKRRIDVADQAMLQFKDALAALRTAASNGDRMKIYQAALAWRRCCPPHVAIPNSFDREVAFLETALYRPSENDRQWRPKMLVRAAEQATRPGRARKRKGNLPALYPEGAKRPNIGNELTRPVAG
ncbi:MAG: BatD family protein [Alphaproteobacteria bacterium]|nr:BatD family protein [Alphaproteobacteria bacterium]